MSKLKEKLMLSEKGYSDLKKAITACTITNIALLLPSMVACLLFWELLKPFTGEAISWAALWKLLGLGLVAAILVFLAAKNDYRKTYIASYKEASTTRLRIAEHLRKLPMSFFNTKDLSDITTNMMADCSSMESMLSSTIPPLIANIISVIYDEIIKGTEALDDAEVPDVGRVLTVTPGVYRMMKKCPDIALDCDISAEQKLSGVIALLDGMEVVKIPKNRMPENFGFMIAHPVATVAPTKLEEYKVHQDPPGISGELIEGRIVYDAFVLDNKKKAIYYMENKAS